MKIVYRVTEEDFMEARDLLVKNEKWSRRLSRRSMPWMGASIILSSIVIFAFGKDRFEAVPFALIGVYFLYCGLALRPFFKKLYRRDPRYRHEITADITEDRVHVVTSAADTRLKWDSIVRFLESDKIFMFFYSERSFSVVPKNAFAPGEVETFRELLQRKIPQSQRGSLGVKYRFFGGL